MADHVKLAHDCERAISLLRTLSDPAAAGGDPNKLITEWELRWSYGLVFAFMTKAGLAISGVKGHGFLIARLPEGTCAPWSPVYSAPLFLKISGAGIGATIGQEDMEEIITMGSHRAVEKLAEAKRGKSIGGVEVIMGAGDDVAELDVGKTAPKPDKAVKPRQHIVRRGTIIDLAFRGASFKRDDARNDLVYGPGVSPYDIIRGDVPPPTEFLPLYDELHKRAGLAWPAGPETSPDLAPAEVAEAEVEVEVDIDAPVAEVDVVVP